MSYISIFLREEFISFIALPSKKKPIEQIKMQSYRQELIDLGQLPVSYIESQNRFFKNTIASMAILAQQAQILNVRLKTLVQNNSLEADFGGGQGSIPNYPENTQIEIDLTTIQYQCEQMLIKLSRNRLKFDSEEYVNQSVNEHWILPLSPIPDDSLTENISEPIIQFDIVFGTQSEPEPSIGAQIQSQSLVEAQIKPQPPVGAQTQPQSLVEAQIQPQPVVQTVKPEPTAADLFTLFNSSENRHSNTAQPTKSKIIYSETSQPELVETQCRPELLTQAMNPESTHFQLKFLMNEHMCKYYDEKISNTQKERNWKKRKRKEKDEHFQSPQINEDLINYIFWTKSINYYLNLNLISFFLKYLIIFLEI